LAAQELDTVWDSQVSILNSSYAKTLDLLSSGKTKAAAEEFHVNFFPAVKKIYSEAPNTYPARFSKINDWCAWVKGLYLDSGRADKALSSGKTEDAAKLLSTLRESFFKLHSETGTLQANDYVYAIWKEAAKDQPSAAEIKSLSAKLADAKPSSRTKKSKTDFAGACGRFQQAVDPLVADGKIDPAEIKSLRDASETLYKAYGVDFE